MPSNDFDLPSKPAKKSAPAPAATSSVEVAPVEKAPSAEANVGPKYDPSELLAIFDEIIFSGEYREEVILRGRLPVKFSTRTAEQIGHIQDVIDSSHLNLMASVEAKRTILSLEQALVSYNGTNLGSMDAKARSQFVSELPGPVIAMLLDKLNVFDAKVAAACREETNF